MTALFDAAYKPNLAAVKAAGGIAMSVYLTGQYASTCASPAELHAVGLGALGNYEEGASQLLTCGESGGVTIGQKAAAAYMAKGAPAGQGLGLAFSLDVNTPVSKLPAVGAAFTGIRTGLAGRFVPMVYGEGAAIDYLWTNHQVLGVEWLSGSESFPGFNRTDVHVAMVQEVGSPVSGTDVDTITNLDALAPLIWWPAGSPYARGASEMLDANDPVVAGLRQEIASVGKLAETLAQIVIWGDKTHPDSISSLANDMAALKAAVASLSPGGAVDVDALAKALAAHLALTAD